MGSWPTSETVVGTGARGAQPSEEMVGALGYDSDVFFLSVFRWLHQALRLSVFLRFLCCEPF